MTEKFSSQLDTYMRQAGLPLRRVADEAGIPHQTLFNWRKGSQPRWHAGLPEDIHRLGSALGLNEAEIRLLIQLAERISTGGNVFDSQEVAMESAYRLPKRWFPTGDDPFEFDPDKYDMGVDPEVTYQKMPCVTIKAGPNPNEFAALAQAVKADNYRGKRLRFSAAVRTAELENMAALFMRISGPDDKLLAFDNMRNRKITGTTDWTPYAVVLDVAEEADAIGFGFFLSLKGQVWMADVRLEEVGQEVPTTDVLDEIEAYFPANLDFKD